MTRRSLIAVSCLFVLTFIVYFNSNPEVPYYYDYTFRVAGLLLSGELGQTELPPPWLNEMVPFHGQYYSVFPLGAVLTMVPVALMKKMGVIENNPAAFLSALCAGLVGVFYFLLALRSELTHLKRMLLVVTMLFGTWMWTNMGYTGAWQLALGFAVLGEAAALYFTIVRRRPLLAGLCFAMAFGNRTEIVLTAPIFFYLLLRDEIGSPRDIPRGWKTLAQFCLVPLVLGVATLAYNAARFQSPFDFGYARIPGVLEEPWYRHGIFSIYYIPLNFQEMLLRTWKPLSTFPYFVPTGFGGSIVLTSPFLVLLFRRGARAQWLTRAAWAAVAVMTAVLWCHGNPGGWQFSYRYAMVLLPWIFLILLENGPKTLTTSEGLLFGSSIAMNAYATWLFHWTDYVRP
jgi:hypothetical protein